MSRSVQDIFRRHARPLAPEPTGVEPVLKPLPGCAAVLFDVYGTLIVSASGDIDASDQASRVDAMASALGPDLDPTQAVAALDTILADGHAAARRAGIEHPELEIRDVWAALHDRLRPGEPGPDAAEIELQIAEYEAVTNPTWPQPGAAASLDALSSAGFVLGLVSNAQFYTREMLRVSLPAAADLPADLVVLSYQHRHAKPDTLLYERAAEALRTRGIEPDQVLFVGNDRLKDILPASRTGFRTALFAGDARSYRPRDGDVRLIDVVPDLVLTDLAALNQCLARP
jgi:putative hydrolase of the HAD superfamily